MPTKLAHNLEEFANWIVDLLIAKDPNADIVELIEEAKKAYIDHYPKSTLDLSDFENLKQEITKHIPSLFASYAAFANSTPLAVIQLQAFKICLKSMKSKEPWFSYYPYDFLLFTLVEKIKGLNPGQKEYEKESLPEACKSFPDLFDLLLAKIEERIVSLKQQTSTKYQAGINAAKALEEKKIKEAAEKKALEEEKERLEAERKAKLAKIHLVLAGEGADFDVLAKDNPDKYILELNFVEREVKKFKRIQTENEKQKNNSHSNAEEETLVETDAPQTIKRITIELNWHTVFGIRKIELTRYNFSLIKTLKNLYLNPAEILSSEDIKMQLSDVIDAVLQEIQYKINPARENVYTNTFVFYSSSDNQIAQLYWWDNFGKSYPISLDKYPLLDDFFNKYQGIAETDLQFKFALMQIAIEKEVKSEKPKTVVFGLDSLMLSRVASLNKANKPSQDEVITTPIKTKEEPVLEEPPFLISRSLNQDRARIVSYVLVRKKDAVDETIIESWDLYVKKANLLRKIDSSNPLISGDIQKLIELEQEADKNRQALWDLKISLVETLKAIPEKEYDAVFYTEENPILFTDYPIYSYVFSWDDKEQQANLYFLDQFKCVQYINAEDVTGLIQFQSLLKSRFLSVSSQDERKNIFFELRKKLETLLDGFKLKTTISSEKKSIASLGLFSRLSINLILVNEPPAENEIKHGTYALAKENNQWVLYYKSLKKFNIMPIPKLECKKINSLVDEINNPPVEKEEDENAKKEKKDPMGELRALIKAFLYKAKQEPKKEFVAVDGESIARKSFLEARAILEKTHDESSSPQL